jgi:cytochrome P450
VNTNSALKTIYGHKANVRKSDFYTAFPANKNTFNVHSSIDKTAHARKRRVLSHAFSDGAMKSMEKFILDKVRVFCRVLPQAPLDLLHIQSSETKGWSAAQNMGSMSDYLAFDVMGELAFGKSFDMMESERNRFASTLVGNAAHRHLIVSSTHPVLHDNQRLTRAYSVEHISQSTIGILTKSSFAKLRLVGRSIWLIAVLKPWNVPSKA